jgi:hypothetical protein
MALTKADYNDAARMAYIEATRNILKSIESSGDTAAADRVREALAKPSGQALPSTNENPNGWVTDDWTDPAFAGWAPDANGIMQPPAAAPLPVVSTPAAIDLLASGDRFQKDGIIFEVFETPFGNMAKRIGPVPPAQPTAPTVASVTAALVTYIKERYTLTSDAEAQTELRLLLAFLAGSK